MTAAIHYAAGACIPFGSITRKKMAYKDKEKLLKRYYQKSIWRKIRKKASSKNVFKISAVFVQSIISVATLLIAIYSYKISVNMEMLAEDANVISDGANIIAEEEKKLHQAEVDYNEYISRPWFLIEKRDINNTVSEILYLLEEDDIDMRVCDRKTFMEYFNEHQDIENEWYRIYDENMRPDFAFAASIPEGNIERAPQYENDYYARNLFYRLNMENVEYLVSNIGNEVEYFDVLVYQYIDICLEKGDQEVHFHFPIKEMDGELKHVAYPKSSESFWMLDDYYLNSLMEKMETELKRSDLDFEEVYLRLDTFFLIRYPFMDSFKYKIYQEERENGQVMFRETDKDCEYPDEHFYELCEWLIETSFNEDLYDSSVIMGDDIAISYGSEESVEEAVGFIGLQLTKNK